MTGGHELDGWAMPVGGLRASLCATCRWKHPGASTCLAFGGGIPTEILTGAVDHRLPYPGDLGIQYEPRVEGEEVLTGYGEP